VLVFNAEKEHFVLHQLDSTFDMRLQNNAAGKSRKTMNSKDASGVHHTAEPLPLPSKKPAKRQPSPSSDEYSDDGLLIEYPGGKPTSSQPPRRLASPVSAVAKAPSVDGDDVDDDANAAGDQQRPTVTAADQEELDLEVELELALAAETETKKDGAESEESEEE
jgi:hypothetical protein